MPKAWDTWTDPGNSAAYYAVAAWGLVTFGPPRLHKLTEAKALLTFPFTIQPAPAEGDDEAGVSWRGAERLIDPGWGRQLRAWGYLAECFNHTPLRVTAVFPYDAIGMTPNELSQQRPIGWLLNNNTLVHV
jgi:hypothetical protein